MVHHEKRRLLSVWELERDARVTPSSRMGLASCVVESLVKALKALNDSMHDSSVLINDVVHR
jgi:hypothetical protein